jgi:hypothetical protein
VPISRFHRSRGLPARDVVECITEQAQRLSLALPSTRLAIIKGSWTVTRGLKREARPADLIGAAAARGMSKPTPIVLTAGF